MQDFSLLLFNIDYKSKMLGSIKHTGLISSVSSLKLFICLFIWLPWVLVVAQRKFELWHMLSSSLTGYGTWAP